MTFTKLLVLNINFFVTNIAIFESYPITYEQIIYHQDMQSIFMPFKISRKQTWVPTHIFKLVKFFALFVAVVLRDGNFVSCWAPQKQIFLEEAMEQLQVNKLPAPFSRSSLKISFKQVFNWAKLLALGVMP